LEDVGRVLDNRLGYSFLSLTVRISYGTVYAVKAYISTPSTVIDEVDNALPLDQDYS